MSIFDYNSVPMRVLNKAADLIFVNVLFAVCSLPVVTIGAAQAGLYTAVKVLRDRKDDRPVLRSFFRGFRNGFGKITAVWCGYLFLAAVFVMTLLARYRAGQIGGQAWSLLFAVVILALFEPITVQFHARYECGIGQLLKNTLLFFLGNPLRAVLCAALTWGPVLLWIFLPALFALISPSFILFYFSGTYLLIFMLMEKPFRTMVGDGK